MKECKHDDVAEGLRLTCISRDKFRSFLNNFHKQRQDKQRSGQTDMHFVLGQDNKTNRKHIKRHALNSLQRHCTSPNTYCTKATLNELQKTFMFLHWLKKSLHPSSKDCLHAIPYRLCKVGLLSLKFNQVDTYIVLRFKPTTFWLRVLCFNV